MAPRKQPLEDRVEDHSRRLKMLEEVYAPLAKTAMDILAGKEGSPGMAEDLRNVKAALNQLLDAYKKDAIETQAIRKNGFERIEALEWWQQTQQANAQVRIAGINVSGTVAAALINGAITLLAIVVTWRLAQP